MPFIAFLLIASAVGVATVAAAFRLRDRTYAITAGLTGATLIYFVNAGLHARIYHDDAFITLRYARNLASGLGPVYNDGERVEGYTNFLWMVLLAGMHAVGIDLVAASRLLAYGSSLACLLLVWRVWSLWADVADDEGDGIIGNPGLLAVTLVLIGLNGAVAQWAFAGLETPLAMALLTGAVYLFLVEQRSGRLPLSALVFAAGAMTRPEVAGVVALTAAYGFGDAWLRHDRAALRRMALWSAIFLAAYAPYFAWRWWYYGYLLPNTFYVKVGSNEDTISRGIAYIVGYGNSYGFLPLLVGAAALCANRAARIRRDAAYVIAVVVTWLVMVAVEGGDAFPHGRFLAPVVPLLTLAGVAGLGTVLSRAIKAPRQFAVVSVTAAALLGLTLAQSSTDANREQGRQLTSNDRTAGLLLRDRVPATYTIGVLAAGSTPYYAQLRTLDMLGLADEVIAHTDVPRLGSGLAGHEKYNIDYVLDVRRPEIILTSSFAPAPYRRGEIEARASVPGFQLPAHTLLVRDPRTWERYQMSALVLDGNWYSFLQRKDTLTEFRPDWTDAPGTAE